MYWLAKKRAVPGTSGERPCSSDTRHSVYPHGGGSSVLGRSTPIVKVGLRARKMKKKRLGVRSS